MRKQKKSVVFFLFDILRTCFLKKLHTQLQCCKVLARARSACQCLRTSCWTLKTSKRRPAAPSLHTEAHDVILYHEDGTTHAHRGGEKKKSQSVTERYSSSVCVCVLITKRESEREAAPPPFPSNIFSELEWERAQLHLVRTPPLFFLLFKMSVGSDFGNPLRKFKLVFLGEQSGKDAFNSL